MTDEPLYARFGFTDAEWGLLVGLPQSVLTAASAAERDSARKTRQEAQAGLDEISDARASASPLVTAVASAVLAATGDPDLVRVMGEQTKARVGLVPFVTVEGGPAAIRDRLQALEADGVRYAVTDALTDAHLRALGTALDGAALITGGSGIAMGLPDNFRQSGALAALADPGALPAVAGHAAVLAGSCSTATLGQIAEAETSMPVLRLDPLATPDADALARTALDWAASRLGSQPIVIAASASPDRVGELQGRLGRHEAGALVERALSAIAQGLVARGVRRLVSAGGETSGAIVSGLGVTSLRLATRTLRVRFRGKGRLLPRPGGDSPWRARWWPWPSSASFPWCGA